MDTIYISIFILAYFMKKMFECNSDDNKKNDKNDVEYSLDRVRLFYTFMMTT